MKEEGERDWEGGRQEPAGPGEEAAQKKRATSCVIWAERPGGGKAIHLQKWKAFESTEGVWWEAEQRMGRETCIDSIQEVC